MATLSTVLQDIGAIIDQDTTLPSGTELTARVNLVNQALAEWGETYQWAQLRVFKFAPTVIPSMTSLALPSNFEKLMSRPWDMGTGFDYEEVRGEDYYQRRSQDVNSRFCITGGDDAAGKFLLINPALPSGASLMFDYQSTPSSMATLQDVLVCPSKDFIVKRAISKIYESRADTRFPIFKAQADDALSNLMQEEATYSGAATNKTPDQYQKQHFRIGE